MVVNGLVAASDTHRRFQHRIRDLAGHTRFLECQEGISATVQEVHNVCYAAVYALFVSLLDSPFTRPIYSYISAGDNSGMPA